jgi:hypothetical protein
MIACLCLAMFAVAPGRADDKPAPKADRPVQVIIRLHDRTTIHRASLPDGVEFITKYGKLTVPASDIRRIDFGRHIPEATTQKIAGLLKTLGGPEFKKREEAAAELVHLGASAYPALKAALVGADLDLTKRLQDVLDQIEEDVPEEQLQLPTQDRLQTADCILTGRVAGDGIKARTAAFGEVTFKLSELRSFHAILEGSAVADATKCGSADDQWAETDFVADGDTGLVITATGKVDVNPTQAGTAISGPEGKADVGNGNGGPIGSLLGKIGENGVPFPIGKKNMIRTGDKGGKLYLHIVAPPDGNGATGAYKVKVLTDPDVPADRRIDQPPEPKAAAKDPDTVRALLMIAQQIELQRNLDEAARERVRAERRLAAIRGQLEPRREP